MTRVIYSLHFDLEPDADGNTRELIAVLTRDGNSTTCRAVDKPRVIDLRDGDLVRHNGKTSRILKVSAYRNGHYPDGVEPGPDGYQVRE